MALTAQQRQQLLATLFAGIQADVITISLEQPFKSTTNTRGTQFLLVTTEDGSEVGIHQDAIDKFKTDLDLESGKLPADWKISESGVLYKRDPQYSSTTSPWKR